VECALQRVQGVRLGWRPSSGECGQAVPRAAGIPPSSLDRRLGPQGMINADSNDDHHRSSSRIIIITGTRYPGERLGASLGSIMETRMNIKIGIIAADGARARCITAEVVDDLDREGNPRLEEHENVVNPLAKVPAREAFTDRQSRKPSGAGPAGAGPTTDDHRDRHEAEDERRFAREVVAAAQRLATEQRVTRLVLAAAPRLLGVLRAQVEPIRGGSVDLIELPLDLSSASLPQIRDALVRRGLLPEPEQPRSGVFHPRGQAPSPR
jgi:protein required for attachment to host cells